MRQPLLQVIGDAAPRRGPPLALKASAVSSILELRSSRLVQSDLLAVAVATAWAVYAGVVFVVKGSCASGTPFRGHRWRVGRRKAGAARVASSASHSSAGFLLHCDYRTARTIEGTADWRPGRCLRASKSAS